VDEAEDAVVAATGRYGWSEGQPQRFPRLPFDLKFPYFTIPAGDLQQQFILGGAVIAVVDEIAQPVAVDRQQPVARFQVKFPGNRAGSDSFDQKPFHGAPR